MTSRCLLATKIKPGSVMHAELVMKAGFMIYDDDPRWPASTIKALIKRHDSQLEYSVRNWWGRLVSGITYPTPDKAVRWFFSNGSDNDGIVDMARERMVQMDLFREAA